MQWRLRLGLGAFVGAVAMVATACGGGGGKVPAVAKMVPRTAAHALLLGDPIALKKTFTAHAKRFYPYFTEETFVGMGALAVLGSEGKFPVNVLDEEDLKKHGIDPTGGLAVWFDDPDEATVIIKVTDEAAAEDVLEDMFHEMERERETKEGVKITHYKKASDYGPKRGFAYAFVEKFMLVLIYSTYGDPPNLGAWAKRAFSVDETLADGEAFKRGSKLLSGGTTALTYHFNPEAFFAAQKKKLERERDEALKREKGAPPAGSVLPTSTILDAAMAKKAPVGDMAPEPAPPGPPGAMDPGYSPPPDPFGSSPFGARSSEAIKEEIKKLAELQDELDWATGVTAGWAFGSDTITGDLVIGLTEETAASARAAIPEVGPDTKKLRAKALAFVRVSMSGEPVFDALEPLMETAGAGMGLLGLMMGLPTDPGALGPIAKELEKYVTGTAEVLLLGPPADIKDELSAVRAVGIALWSGDDKIGETVDDYAAAAAESSGLEKEGKDDVNGVTVHRFTLSVPGKKDKPMELPVAYAADGEYAIGAAGEGVIEEALASAGPNKTAKNDGTFLHLALFPSRVPLKGYPTDTYLAATPLVMVYLSWIEKLEVVGTARGEGLHVHGELKIAKP